MLSNTGSPHVTSLFGAPYTWKIKKVTYQDETVEYQVYKVSTSTEDVGSEVYKFRTLQFAQAQHKFCMALLTYYTSLDSLTYTLPYIGCGSNMVSFDVRSSLGCSTFFNLGGKRVFETSRDGEVILFDLPHLVLLWLKTTWLGRTPKTIKKGLHTLWYGVQHKSL